MAKHLPPIDQGGKRSGHFPKFERPAIQRFITSNTPLYKQYRNFKQHISKLEVAEQSNRDSNLSCSHRQEISHSITQKMVLDGETQKIILTRMNIEQFWSTCMCASLVVCCIQGKKIRSIRTHKNTQLWFDKSRSCAEDTHSLISCNSSGSAQNADWQKNWNRTIDGFNSPVNWSPCISSTIVNFTGKTKCWM